VQVVEKRMRILGHEHPHTLVAMNNLATTYKNQRRWNEAEDLQMQVVSILRTTLGDDHPSTVIATSNLALYRRVRAVLWPFLVGKELMGGLWDKLQQFVALWKS